MVAEKYVSNDWTWASIGPTNAGPYGQKLTSVLLDEIVNAGVLRHISDGVGQHAVNGVSDIFVRGLQCAFNRIACAVVLVILLPLAAVAMMAISALVAML